MTCSVLINNMKKKQIGKIWKNIEKHGVLDVPRNRGGTSISNFFHIRTHSSIWCVCITKVPLVMHGGVMFTQWRLRMQSVDSSFLFVWRGSF